MIKTIIMMLCFFFLIICLWFHPSYSSQQNYDRIPCSSVANFNPGTRYTCGNSSRNQCTTFLVYRANQHMSTISNISTLFRIEPSTLLSINKNITSNQTLPAGHEVLVPVQCQCSRSLYEANFTYTVKESATSITTIACDIFQGLVNSFTLAEENVVPNNVINAGFLLRVPLKCACPDDNQSIKYLVTYPLIEGDYTEKLSQKFNVSVEEIWRANQMDPMPTVFPNTTVLIPLRKEPPLINFSGVPDSEPPFLPTKRVEKRRQGVTRNFFFYIAAGSVVGFFVLIVALYLKIKSKSQNAAIRISSLNSFSTPNSCLSPDLLVGIKYYSVCNYTMEELRQATKNFSEDAKISGMYRGLIDNELVMMVKETRPGQTKGVIDFHSKINHVNIVKLHGVGYGDESNYLVFDHPSNGSLRDCLACSSGVVVNWHKRTQIAFDIATGLHYLHYSVTPVCAHLSLSCNNIFLSSDWRAKIMVLGMENEKVDVVVAFGVVVLEIISGKEGECVRFLGRGGGGGGGGCFEELRDFVDPNLKGDFPIAEALCLAVLGASCVDDDPNHRPSMDDVLKVVARMV